MTNLTFARPYATAAFSLANQKSALAHWNDFLQAAKNIVENSLVKEVKTFLNDPRISAVAKSQAFMTLITKNGYKLPEGEAGKEITQFINVLAEAKKLILIGAIADIFVQKVAEKKGEHFVNIETAYPMSKAVESLIIDKLEKVFSLKLIPKVLVNHKLVGGFRATVGSKVCDCSLATSLENAHQIMMV